MKSEPFLWIHLAGLAVLPLCLEMVWLGLGIGVPLLPVWLEFALVVTVGALPILWMQWTRPFYLFGLLLLAVRPDQLTLEQRKILSLCKSSTQKLLALIMGVALTFILWKLAQVAPLTTHSLPMLPSSHLVGLGIVAVAFLASNLFLQVSVNALSVLLTKEEKWTGVEPMEVNQISQQFTILGFQIKKLFSPLASN